MPAYLLIPFPDEIIVPSKSTINKKGSNESLSKSICDNSLFNYEVYLVYYQEILKTSVPESALDFI